MDEQRVTVGFSGRGDLTTNLAGCPRFCFDHTRLLENGLEHRNQRPANHVGSTTRREWIDEGNGVRGVSVLREGRPQAECRRGRGATGNEMTSIHVSPPWKTLFCRDLARGFSLGGMLSPGPVGNQASMIATALVQPAEPPRTFTGKQLTVKPVGGSASRL